MTPQRTYESLAQAAERTDVSVKTLRRRISAGQLRAYRYGPRILRLDPNDVDKLMRPVPNARS
jgi:excisionase family DNA binding protein|nr:helix-turn-helix domain-containing protein [Propionibacterium sp.]